MNDACKWYLLRVPLILSITLSKASPNSCPGASLLQTSTHSEPLKLITWRSALSHNHSLAADASVLHRATTRVQWSAVIVLTVVMLIAALLALARLCIDRNEELADADKSAASSTEPPVARQGVENDDDDQDYEAVEEEESDAGDWQVDDLVSDRMGFHFGRGAGPGAGVIEAHERSEYDPGCVVRHIEENYGSWNLLRHILKALVEFWAALAFMYWSLFNKEEELMDCPDYSRKNPQSVFVGHACFYTVACLRGFPILAANMVLVLMIRILVQTRLYYSMLKMGFVLDFANSPVMRTIWPWACGISMFQGFLHFVLKAVWVPETLVLDMWVRLVRKFLLPGTIFFSFLFRYADIENTLVPLNRICELQYSQHQRNCPWLEKIQVMNERVFAFDARHRDVVGATKNKVGRAPTLQDIVDHIIEHYDKSHKHWKRRRHRGWGLFRSMWPASVLVDRRLDRHDPETRAWLQTFAILVSGCALASLFSLYLLFACTTENALHSFFDSFTLLVQGKLRSMHTEVVLANVVMLVHGLFIGMFISRTIHNMFKFKIQLRGSQMSMGMRSATLPGLRQSSR